MERRDRGRFIRGLVAVGDFCCIRYDPSIQSENSLAFTEYILFPGSIDV